MSTGMELAIENLKAELKKIRSRVSECRKNGFDTKIADLLLISVPPKIQMAEVTKSHADIEKANTAIQDVKNEVISIEKSSEEDEKPAIEMDEVLDLIDLANKSIGENNIQEAKNYYLKCVNIYNKLGKDAKKDIFEKLNKIRLKINNLS